MVLIPDVCLDFLIGGFGFGSSSIQLIQVQVDLYGVIRLLLGQKNYRLNMARLLQIDVKRVAKFAFVRGNLSKRVFSIKHADFYPCMFSETGQRPCSYLYSANAQIFRPLQDFALTEQV